MIVFILISSNFIVQKREKGKTIVAPTTDRAPKNRNRKNHRSDDRQSSDYFLVVVDNRQRAL